MNDTSMWDAMKQPPKLAQDERKLNLEAYIQACLEIGDACEPSPRLVAEWRAKLRQEQRDG